MALIERPFEPLKADECVILVDRLEDSLAAMEAWGLNIHAAGRSPTAVRKLRTVVEAGAYPVDQAALIAVGNAIKLAFDIVQVTDAFPDPPPKVLLDALKRTLKGTLDDVGPTPAHRAQSELTLGLTMAAAGLRPGMPDPPEGKRPDFIVSCDDLPFGCEVKRPKGEPGIEGNLDDAIAQYDDYGSKYNCVLLDLSDCLPWVAGTSDLEVARQDNQAAFRHAYSVASDYVRSRATHDARFKRVCVLIAVADYFLWVPEDDNYLPFAIQLFLGEVFHDAVAGLVTQTSKRLRAAVFRGMHERGGALMALRRV